MGEHHLRGRHQWRQAWPFYIYFEAKQLRQQTLRDQLRTATALEAQSARLARAIEGRQCAEPATPTAQIGRTQQHHQDAQSPH